MSEQEAYKYSRCQDTSWYLVWTRSSSFSFSLIDTERPNVRPKADFGWTDYYTLQEVSVPHIMDQAL